MANDDTLYLSSTLTPTRGFHTSSTTRLVLRGSHSHSCALHLYFELPAQLFADPYELDHRRRLYTFKRFGGGNLEAPVFAPGAGGPSGLLLDVAVPGGGGGESRDDGDILDIEVPLHARYGVPKRDGELIDEVVLPPPEAFWACAQERADGDGHGHGGERMKVPEALHKVVELAPALKRASKLVLIPHAEAIRAQALRVPVGYAGDVALVETGTVVVILLAFVYLLHAIVRASRAQDVAVKTSVAKKDS
ncbi:PIG-X [Lactarius psammicola]|nr:PIG-X [Lactarius psammicola]